MCMVVADAMQYLFGVEFMFTRDGPRDPPCHSRRVVNEGGHSLSSSCDGRT